MNGFETTIERWHDYYVAAGGAAAVLLGLLFVSEEIEQNFHYGSVAGAGPLGWGRANFLERRF